MSLFGQETLKKIHFKDVDSQLSFVVTIVIIDENKTADQPISLVGCI